MACVAWPAIAACPSPVTSASPWPSTGHRGHMPSEYLGIAVKGSRALGVAWEAMKGRYPDDVYVSVPLRGFGR